MNLEDKIIFKKRFHEYYVILCRIAYSFICDKDECEDIVQEVFISVWNNQKELLTDKDFLSYMTTAVRNKCISFLRKQRLNVVSLEDSEYASTLNIIVDTEPINSDEKTVEEKLQVVLEVLPPRCKQIFIMSKLRGMKYREISHELQISEKTVENQMGKALKLLREYAQNNPFIFLITTLVSIAINYKLK